MSTTTNVNSLLSSVPKLTGSGNHANWKFAIAMVLRRAGLWTIIQEWIDKRAMDQNTVSSEEAVEASAARTRSRGAKAAEEKARESEEVLTIIGLTLDPSQYQHIADCTDGVEAWAKLAEIYEKDSRPSRIALKRDFYTFAHDSLKPVQDYVSGIGRLASALRAIGVKIDSRDEVDVMIYNLSPEWGSIASTLTASSAELTVADVTGALLDEEKRRGGAPNDGSTALVAHSKKKFSFTCYKCHQKGHIARNCPSVQSKAHVAMEYAF